MYDDDAETRDAIEASLEVVGQETVRLRHDLDAIKSDLTRVMEIFLQATRRGDLALDFLQSLGNTRGTLH
jgi:hypothetical protein